MTYDKINKTFYFWFFVKSEKASKQASSELEPEGPNEIPPDFPEMNDSFQVGKASEYYLVEYQYGWVHKIKHFAREKDFH